MGLIKKIKDLIAGGAISMKGVEDDMLGSTHIETKGHNISISNVQSGAFADALNGVESQALKEMRASFYAVTEKVEGGRFVLDEETGLRKFVDRDYESEANALGGVVIYNQKAKATLYEELNGVTNENVNKVEFEYNSVPTFNLSKLVTSVKLVNSGSEKELTLTIVDDFSESFNNLRHRYKPENKNLLRTIFEFSEVAFKTDGRDKGVKPFESFLYKFKSLNQITLHKDTFTVKYTVTPIVEHLNTIEKYKMDSVTNAYNEKRPRNQK